jgi:uncharacterized protein (DUF849 family)
LQAALNGPFTKADHPAMPVAAGAAALHVHPRDADGRERLDALVAAWTAPDYASVNVSEAGAKQVMRALLRAGIGIEAGVWTVEDAERLGATGLAGRLTRVLVERVDVRAGDAVALVDDTTACRARPRCGRVAGAASVVLAAAATATAPAAAAAPAVVAAAARAAG